MTRDRAYKLLTEYTTKVSLIRHALTVEAIMRAYASKYGENEEEWGNVGLLHDFDYEKFPEEHPYEGAKILKQKNVSQDWTDAIMGHGTFTGVERKTNMAKILFAVDELSGLITAAALIRPDQKIAELEVKSIKKKMKDKRFAAAVNREDIILGAGELGIDLDDHISFVLKAMQENADKINL